MAMIRGLRIGTVYASLARIMLESERLASIAPDLQDSAEYGGYMLELSDIMQEYALCSGDGDICAAISCELDHSDMLCAGAYPTASYLEEEGIIPDFDMLIEQEAAIEYCENSQTLMNMTLKEAIDYYNTDAVIN